MGVLAPVKYARSWITYNTVGIFADKEMTEMAQLSGLRAGLLLFSLAFDLGSFYAFHHGKYGGQPNVERNNFRSGSGNSNDRSLCLSKFSLDQLRDSNNFESTVKGGLNERDKMSQMQGEPGFNARDLQPYGRGRANLYRLRG